MAQACPFICGLCNTSNTTVVNGSSRLDVFAGSSTKDPATDAGSNSDAASDDQDDGGGIGAGGIVAIVFCVVVLPIGVLLGYLHWARRGKSGNATFNPTNEPPRAAAKKRDASAGKAQHTANVFYDGPRTADAPAPARPSASTKRGARPRGGGGGGGGTVAFASTPSTEHPLPRTTVRAARSPCSLYRAPLCTVVSDRRPVRTSRARHTNVSAHALVSVDPCPTTPCTACHNGSNPHPMGDGHEPVPTPATAICCRLGCCRRISAPCHAFGVGGF